MGLCVPQADDSGLHPMKAHSGGGVKRAVSIVIHLCICDGHGGKIETY